MPQSAPRPPGGGTAVLASDCFEALCTARRRSAQRAWMCAVGQYDRRSAQCAWIGPNRFIKINIRIGS